MNKKVVLCIIDSLHPGVLEQCFAGGLAPNLDFLRKNGFYSPACVSVFPTMTPTATASILTGTQVECHGVPGFVWYNYEQDRWENYGATFSAALKQGLGRTLYNWFYRLNHCHLKKEVLTLHEQLSKQGLKSANLNFFMRRGSVKHEPNFPWLLRLLSGKWLRGEQILGPEELILGKIIYPPGLTLQGAYLYTPWKRYGINDAFTAAACLHLIQRGELPELTLLYFPDNDHYSHRHGPWATSKIIRRVDAYLGEILRACGSDEVLNRMIFIIMGDHAQTPVLRGKEAVINLEQLLPSCRVLRLGAQGSRDSDLVISPNERMAYIDILHERLELRRKIVGQLAKDPRIAQVMWREEKTYFVKSGGNGQLLAFSSGGSFKDDAGIGWDFEGDIAVVGGKVKENTVHFAEYPDAFNRIRHALEARPETCIALSAAPGYEFGGEAAAIHPGGGSHGSLHREDSLVPLIIAGTDKQPQTCQIDKIAPFILEHLTGK